MSIILIKLLIIHAHPRTTEFIGALGYLLYLCAKFQFVSSSRSKVWHWIFNWTCPNIRSHNPSGVIFFSAYIHAKNFMAIFTTLSVVIWFASGTLGIFATLVYVFTMCMIIYDILSMAIIPTLSTSILFCNLCYILLWISPRSVVKIAIRI